MVARLARARPCADAGRYASLGLSKDRGHAQGGGGWTFSGDGNRAGMVSGNREPRGAPQAPHTRRRPGAAGPPLDFALGLGP